MTVQVPAQTLERLRNWQRSVDALNGMIQATVDALCEAQDGASDSTQEG